MIAPVSFTSIIAGTARAYRLGMDGAGHDGLQQLLGHLHQALEARQLDVSARDLQDVLSALAQAQARNDILRLADLLEYRLAPLLAVPFAAAGTVPMA